MPRTFIQPMRLRHWLFGTSLAALVPALVFAVYAALQFERVSQRAILDDLKHRTEALRDRTERMLDHAASTLDTLAQSDSAQAGHWLGLYEQARRTVAHDPSVRAVTLVDRSGQVLFHTGVPFGTPLFKAHAFESVEAVMATGRVHVSTAFRAPISPKPVAAVSVPLRRDGQIQYVLRAIILLDTLDRLVSDAALPAGWVGGVTDPQGVILARSLTPELYVGKPAAPSFIEGIRRGDGNPFQGTTLEGVPTRIVVLPVHGGDWFLGVAVPEAVLNASLDESVRELAVFAVFWIGLALALSYLFGGYLAGQAKTLVAAVSGSPHQGHDGRPVRVAEFSTLLDGVSESKRREADAHGRMDTAVQQRDQAIDLYDRAPCGYHSLDPQGRLVRMNQTALDWLGYRWDELDGRAFTDLLATDSQARFAAGFARFLELGHVEDVELTLKRKDGSTLAVSANASAVVDAQGQLLCSRSSMFDITERKALEAQLDRLSRTDGLTGLSNRRDFQEQATRELQRVQRHGVPLAVLLLDVDHFKRINDACGHEGGDKVLQALSTTCVGQLRTVDVVARIGGEEFAVLLPDTAAERAGQIAERLRQAIGAIVVMLPGDRTVTFTVSIGVAAAEAADTSIDAVLRRADQALYEAKAAGRNTVRPEAAEAVGS